MKNDFHKIKNANENVFKTLFQFFLFLCTAPGLKYALGLIRRRFTKFGFVNEKQADYNIWVKTAETTEHLQKEYNEILARSSDSTLHSFVLILDGEEESFPDLVVHSVIKQLYANWELLILCNGKLLQNARKNVNNYGEDSKKIAVHEHLGFTRNTDQLNRIIANNSSKFLTFITSNSLLAPGYLLAIAKQLGTTPQSELIYSDDDLVDNYGNYHTPYFKPDWSPHSLLSRNYIGDCFTISTTLFEKAGGFRPALGPAILYDLLLRATENTSAIAHIPKILMHKFEQDVTYKPEYQQLAKLALEQMLTRRNTPGEVCEVDGFKGVFTIKYIVKSPGRVSIIIPTKDQAAMLKIAIDSIFNLTTYRDFEIIVIDNNSSSPEFFKLIDEYSAKYARVFKCITAKIPFNFPALINLGARAATGEYLLMLNNDVKVLQADWLETMVGYAQYKNVGAVGVKLLFPGDTIQHAGVLLGINEATGHLLINESSKSAGYHNNLVTVNNYSALTGACLMVRKNLYDEVGGMDERLPVEYNDIDFCLKVLQRGHFNVYLPMVTLYHYESATRGHPFRSRKSWEQHDRDLKVFKSKWNNIISHDPFYNVNLTRRNTDFSFDVR